jgi:hypothetical protein
MTKMPRTATMKKTTTIRRVTIATMRLGEITDRIG